MRIRLCLIFILVFAIRALPASLDISGEWRFRLDTEDAGITSKWYDKELTDKIILPGILQSQGYGNDITAETPWVLSLYDRNWQLRDEYKDYIKPGSVKVPFLSQPPKHYLGAAWYQRDIEIPAEWAGKRLSLYLERPHWGSTVWFGDKLVGESKSLVAPHEFELGTATPGKYRLTVRVDNRMLMPYRPDAHSVSDSLGMSWNGIVGKMEVRATSQVWIDDVQVFPDPAAKKATVKVTVKNISGVEAGGLISANGHAAPFACGKDGGKIDLTVDFPDARDWNEFHPQLYKVDLMLIGEKIGDRKTVSFGFSRIKAAGREFKLNGRTIYLRGTHHGGDFPLTGYPPTEKAYWLKIFRINKDWGINHVRFHSFCPPEAAFEAADELGIYLQPEPGMWNEVSPGAPMEKMLYEETDRMIRAYGNHPSFIMLSPSNEPKGRWKEAFDKWIAHYRMADPRRLYTNGTGHTEREAPNLHVGTDYLVMQRIGQKMLRGNSAWFGGDYGKSLEGIDVPVASHELGQWVAYPDYNIIPKFTGYMRPGNYEIFRDGLRKRGLLDRNAEFAYSSGKFQLECYKEEIEANLRTPGLYGYQLLDLHDYLGQGTALVGVLDAFWEEKGYVRAKEFRRFNSETVPLARLAKRVFRSDEKISVESEIAHFGEFPIENAAPYWKIVAKDGKTVISGEFVARRIPIGKNIALGTIDADLSGLNAPGQFSLIVGLKGGDIENSWDFWVYPAEKKAEPKGIEITNSWDATEAALNKGGKVLYMPRRSDLGWESPPLDTIPVFWNRLMNPAWGRMLGLRIDPAHPALTGFPTDSFNGWQWTDILRNARAINLDKLPKTLQPFVQPVDDWNRNYKLGLVFEARVGRGKLIVSGADLETGLAERPAAAQLRASLLEYMAGTAFAPKAALTEVEIRSLLFPTTIMRRLGASTMIKDQALALDGDPNTFWMAGDPKKDRTEQVLEVSFPKAESFSGLLVMPRQNHREHEGDIREYKVMISANGLNWEEVKRGLLISGFEPQRVTFGKTISAKYVRFVAISGFGSDRMVALADLAVIYEGPALPPDPQDPEYKRSTSASPDIDEGTGRKP
jgi:beta-galactosidase